MELLGVVHAQPQLQARLHHVVLLCQLHVHAIVLLEEGVIQEVLDGVPAVKGENQSVCCEKIMKLEGVCRTQTLY